MKKLFLLISLLSVVFLLTSCEDNPSEAGSSVIPSTDAIQTKTLDVDSIPYTYKITSSAVSGQDLGYILLGKHKTEEAVGLLRFIDFPDSLSEAKIISADIVLFPTNYYIGDKSTFGFKVHKVTSTWEAANPGSAMVSGPIYDKTAVGEFSGTIVDTEAVYIPVSNSLVKEWLVYASNSLKSNLNQGVVLIPNANSNCARLFYSQSNTAYSDNSKDPYLRIIEEDDGVRDTLLIAPRATSYDGASNTYDGDTYYAFSNNFNTSSEDIVLQSGVAYRTKFTFDVAKIPAHSHITNAIFTLTLDEANSYTGANTIDSLEAVASTYYSDGTLKDQFTVFGIPAMVNNNKVYNFNITLLMQGWKSGWSNDGMEIFHLGETISIDRMTFYSNKAADLSKRPKLKVTYLTLPN